VQRSGASNDPNAPFGKNTDVKFVSIYQDSNQNDILDANDADISNANTNMIGAFMSTDTLPFNLIVRSTDGFPSSGRLYIGEAELATYSGTGIDPISGKPYLTVASRGEMLGIYSTPVVNHVAGTTVRKVDLFDQNNLLNTQTQIQLAQPQTTISASRR
jgi:hypothetical protein